METVVGNGDCNSASGGGVDNGLSHSHYTTNNTTDINTLEVDCFPCALCGHDLRTLVLIKVEVTDDDLQLQNDQHGDSSSTGSQRKEEDSTKSPALLQPSRWSKDEKLIYRWFLKWFRVNLIKGKASRGTNLGWDPDSGRDFFPFCLECRRQLLAILDLQKAIEELERKIQDEVEVMKGKATCCEDLFDKMKIYGRDLRYKRLRRQIVADFSSRYPIERPQGKPRTTVTKKTTIKTRRSVRTEAVISSTEVPNGNSFGSSEALPVVLLSTSDKLTAELHLASADIKSESELPQLPDDLDHIIENLSKEKSDDEDNQRNYENLNTESSNLNQVRFRKSGRKRKSNKTPKSPQKKIKKAKASVSSSNDQEAYDDNDILLNSEPAYTFADDDHDDDDYQPVDSPPRRRRTSKQSKKRTNHCKNKKWEIIDPDDDYYDPPTPPPFGSSVKTAKRRKKPVDEDFMADDASGDDNDDPHDVELDYFEEDPKTGKLARTKAVVDLEKRTLTYKDLLFYHLEPISDNKYECSECRVEVKHANIRSHYVRKHTNILVCNRCDFQAENRPHLKNHIDRVHKGLSVPVFLTHRSRMTTCSICAKPGRIAKMKDHEWTHKNAEEKRLAMESEDSCVPFSMKKRHQCDLCGRKWALKSQLDKHKQVNHPNEEDKPRTMELCPECGGTYLDLKTHRRNVHGVNRKKMYTCLEPGCEKLFKTLATLTKHKNAVHRKVRPHKCTLCPREFAVERVLKKHMDLHLGIRPWKCEQCTSSFAHKSNLQRHIGIYHTEGSTPKRKAYTRGPAMLPSDVRKRDLINEGKYLPPSALATWAAGREPTSHFPAGVDAANIIASSLTGSLQNN